MVGCPKIQIKVALVEELFISATDKVIILDWANMKKLKLLKVDGKSQRKTDLTIGANTQHWASSKTRVSLSNVTLRSLPKNIVLKSLTLVESVVKSDTIVESVWTPGIEETQISNSSIDTVGSLKSLSSLTKENQMTFENNKILTTCSSCESSQEATCFIGQIKKYKNNSLPCDTCNEDGCECGKGRIFSPY